jgi:hypothetical protein
MFFNDTQEQNLADAHDAAYQAYNGIFADGAEYSRKMREMEAEIVRTLDEQFGAEITARKALMDATEKALTDYRQERDLVQAAGRLPYPEGTVLHEWKLVSHSRGIMPTKRTGRMEIIRPDSIHPDNVGVWCKPRVGDMVIRILKSDGQPGRKYARDYEFENWKPTGVDPNVEQEDRFRRQREADEKAHAEAKAKRLAEAQAKAFGM